MTTIVKKAVGLGLAGFFFYAYTSAGGNQRIGDFTNNSQCVAAFELLAQLEGPSGTQGQIPGIPGFLLFLNTQPGSTPACFQSPTT